MKLRTEFVSNSSTTCFVIRFDGDKITKENVVAKLNELRDFYLKNMTSETIIGQKLEESRAGWDLDRWPVEVIDPLKRTEEAKKAYEEELKLRKNDPYNAIRQLPVVDFDWTVSACGFKDESDMKNAMIIEVPINFQHIADYLRTFLVNLFDAEDTGEIN